MSSDIANIRFIADSTPASFRGSNQQEQDDIDMIRKLYAEHLYSNNPPKKLVDKLAPIARGLIENAVVDKGGSVDELVSLYEVMK